MSKLNPKGGSFATHKHAGVTSPSNTSSTCNPGGNMKPQGSKVVKPSDHIKITDAHSYLGHFAQSKFLDMGHNDVPRTAIPPAANPVMPAATPVVEPGGGFRTSPPATPTVEPGGGFRTPAVPAPHVGTVQRGDSAVTKTLPTFNAAVNPIAAARQTASSNRAAARTALAAARGSGNAMAINTARAQLQEVRAESRNSIAAAKVDRRQRNKAGELKGDRAMLRATRRAARS